MLSDTMMLGGGRKAAYPIDNSLLFRGAQYLTRTPVVAGDQKTFTFHAWVRRSDITVMTPLVGYYNSGPKYWRIDFEENGSIGVVSTASDGGVLVVEAYTTTVFRDPTAWYCVDVVIDTTEPVEADRVKVRVNGVEQSLSFTVAPDENQLCFFGDVGDVHIGEFNGHYAAAQFAEPILVDGAALSPDVFGQIDPVTGSWRPKAVSGVDFGTNGFYLGRPWNAASLGTDASGRGNDWTPVGFAASDVVGDSPTNVYATLNPLKATRTGFSAGNLLFNSSSQWGATVSTLAVSSGKYYAEFSCANASSDNSIHVGVCSINETPWVAPIQNQGDDLKVVTYRDEGGIFKDDMLTPIVTGLMTVSSGSVVGVALDADASSVQFYVNGLAQSGAIPLPEVSGGKWAFFTEQWRSFYGTFNFGQRPFAFTPPSGFQSLCTANLPASTGQTSGTFTGNAAADGPCVFTGAVPETLSINGNAVIWGTHADKLATGFKIRTASAAYNASGANSWVATYDRKPTVGPKNRAPANAQGNP